MGVAWRPGGAGSSAAPLPWAKWGRLLTHHRYGPSITDPGRVTLQVLQEAEHATTVELAPSPSRAVRQPSRRVRSSGLTAGALALAAQAIGPGLLASRPGRRQPRDERIDLTA